MMAWFGIGRDAGSSAREVLSIPLFPLKTVLFPGGILPLRVFEQRYLDMTAACMKDNKPFGVCLIAQGEETGAAADTHPVGTLAEISHWDMEQLGILHITARGGQRFRILETRRSKANLLEADVELIDDNIAPLPNQHQRLLPLLRKVIKDLGPERIAEPHRLDDAEWVGYRITEILPVQNLAKQKLLELEDPLSRLEILEKFLVQRKLIG